MRHHTEVAVYEVDFLNTMDTTSDVEHPKQFTQALSIDKQDVQHKCSLALVLVAL
jgi:hypothetical protein